VESLAELTRAVAWNEAAYAEHPELGLLWKTPKGTARVLTPKLRWSDLLVTH